MGQDFGGRYVYACTVAAAARRWCTERCMCVPQWLSNHRLMRRGVRCRCFHCQMMLHDHASAFLLLWHVRRSPTAPSALLCAAVHTRAAPPPPLNAEERRCWLCLVASVGRRRGGARGGLRRPCTPRLAGRCICMYVPACVVGAALGRFYCSAFKERTYASVPQLTFTYTHTHTPIEAHHAQ